ncbi:MAG: ABC transporter substrate-binding protein [Firmicutes bacterium]|nr:ABC transporter substrate-binding protein [Bacillota bacterium]
MKKAKKRAVLAVLSAAAMAVSFSGCSSGGSQTASDGEKYTVAVIQQIDNGAFSDMRTGFENGLTDSGLNVEFVEYNAQGDATVLQSYVQTAISDNVDLIATIATPAPQAVVSAGTDIPNVFIAVSYPVAAQVLTSIENPDKNSTGTQNPIPVAKIFETAETLTPGIEKYGILYTEAQTNAVSTSEAAKEYLDANSIEYTEKTVTNSSEVQQAVQLLLEDCDALFVPNDATIQDAMPVVVEAANAAGKPVYGSSAVMAQSGALAAVAISDTEIGRISAEMAAEILNGKDVSEVPAQAVEATVTTVNKSTADALGVTVPDGMEVEYAGEE